MRSRNTPDTDLFDPPELTLADARRTGMDLLARREHSRVELQRKLRSRDFPSQLIDEALDGLTADGLQSDSRFAEAFAGSRVQRGQGPVRIRFELKQRGVTGTLIEDALSELDADWYALARHARIKRFGAARPDDFKERARQARFLSNRGFDTDQIGDALDAAMPDD